MYCFRNGDQNWVSVSRTMKQLGEGGRPGDWSVRQDGAKRVPNFVLLCQVQRQELCSAVQPSAGKGRYSNKEKRGEDRLK